MKARGWVLVFAVAIIAVILTASWTLAMPHMPKWTHCPAQGCSDPCDPTVQGPYSCLDKKTGELMGWTTYECCCCVDGAQHRWFRGIK